MFSLDDAIRHFRTNSQYAELVHNAYLGADILDSAQRFLHSSEFVAVRELLTLSKIRDSAVLDLGAGIGLGAYAFAQSGAKICYAVEPDSSDLVGIGAMQTITSGLPIEIVQSIGENLPLESNSVDIYYTRQVLHHTHDLHQVMREAYRVLKPNGLLLACREHVANTPQELEIFLENHPTHQLAGGENAYRLDEYTGAIEDSGLVLETIFAQWDSLINTFPKIKSEDALEQYPETVMKDRFGTVGEWFARVPFVKPYLWSYIKRPVAGALHTFFARKAT